MEEATVALLCVCPYLLWREKEEGGGGVMKAKVGEGVTMMVGNNRKKDKEVALLLVDGIIMSTVKFQPWTQPYEYSL